MSAAVVAAGAVPADLPALGLRVAGLGLLAGVVVTVCAAGYRWYAGGPIPDGVAFLLGAGAVAVPINATATLGRAVGPGGGELAAVDALVTLATFAAAAVASGLGRRAGDGLGTDVVALTGGARLDRDVGRVVRSVGRVAAVSLPDRIEDVEGYDPVEASTKTALAGASFVFPGRLAPAERRERFVRRLRDDYGVGTVDVEFDDAGDVSYLAVGRRPAGLGHTLPPGTTAVAVRADPSRSASPGDAVQVWRTAAAGDDGVARRVATAELRAVAGDVATLAVHETDAEALAPEASYRLVTVPGDLDTERELADLLRAADATVGTVTVAPDGPLAAVPAGALAVAVVAVRRPDGTLVAPAGASPVGPGTLHVVARPDALRALEAAGRPVGASTTG